MIAVVRGNRREAEDLLLLAIDSELRFPEAHYTLGEIYFSQNRVNEALEEFEQVLWEDEDNALGHFGLARVAMAMDRIAIGSVSPHGAATEHWEEFLRLSEGDPALADKRHLALSIIRAYYPHLLER